MTAANATAAEKPRRLRRNPFAHGEPPNSLFGEILDWMLAPLLLLWPISIAATNHVANFIADQPYDQVLADNVAVIGQLIQIDREHITVNMPAPARMLLRNDETDTLYYQVIGLRENVIHGDRQIPAPARPDKVDAGKVLFRDGRIEGEKVRIAYSFIPVRQDLPPVVVQVAETLHKRDELASRIISGVLLPQFAIIPLAVILVYLGLTKGIAPLRLLQERIHRRRPSDLSPIAAQRVPDEVRPLVEAFNEMMERLEENLQAQHRFIAQAAHQMRTPLTGLKTQTEIALSETDPQKIRHALKLIAQSTDRAAHLINQLLILARTEASHEKVHSFAPVDLDLLARQVAQDWVVSALDKSIDLGFEGCEKALMIDGSDLLLRELLSNLLDNAIKYTPVGGQVTIRTMAKKVAVLEVEDNGPGVPPEEREQVFERFYRVLGNDVDGSGLGLPIAEEIAELHRAHIELTDAHQGSGCLFRVEFPRRPPPPPRRPPPPSMPPPIGP
ncbi:MAG: sensor histidine kinase N-terminal domain-containing protein [Gammaproteobacteria bacterium]|nr:sensor histidine kinase N-terminal domain-containing protein [Gammaproteobacteria bacterium]MBU1646913.1 sensor histidine kinase N-terminal domain-containing protein [Gammaproteobacteria bacterium]MBU1971174.1 sensor histidine kinase N-terminal domain-containing protein [Gammaproteobacteria bacterium]